MSDLLISLSFFVSKRFLYYEEAFLDEDIIFDVMYVAKKYMTTHLFDKCVAFLREHVEAENACVVLEMAVLFEHEDLVKRCMQIIRAKTKKIVQNETFTAIGRPALEYILASDILNISEGELYKACLEWAKTKCENGSLPCTTENLRNALGNVLYLIRIPAIDEEDPNVLCLELLTESEREALDAYRNDRVTDLALPFTTSQRRKRSTERIMYDLIDGVTMASFCTMDVSEHVFDVSEDIVLHSIDVLDMRQSSTVGLTVSISQGGEKLLRYVSRVPATRRQSLHCPVVPVYLPTGVTLDAGQFEIAVSYRFFGKSGVVPVGTTKTGIIDNNSLYISVSAKKSHHIAAIHISPVV